MINKDHVAIIDAARKLITDEAKGLHRVAQTLDESFLTSADLVLKAVGKVFIAGSGTSGATARRMAHLFSVCGTPAVYISASDALHGTMGVFEAGDVLINISRGGETYELNELARRVKHRNVPVIALTAQSESTLAQQADVVVKIDSGYEGDPGGVIAMGSTLAVSAWGDALAHILMRVKGYKWSDVLFTHPSGAVGQSKELPTDLEPLKL